MAEEQPDSDDAGEDDADDWFERAVKQERAGLDDQEGTGPLESDPSEDETADESAAGSDQPQATGSTGAAFGFDTDLDDEDSFETDFSTAFDDTDGETFGFEVDDAVASGGADEQVFDDEALDSDIPRIDLGIEGLDEMIQGGVPERSLIVAIGGAGTGKTTFGLQFLATALEAGERAVFITLEESYDRVLQSAEEKGWDFERYAADGDLVIIDLDPIEMANSLTSIRNELPRLVEDFDASRVVLDSVSLLEMMYDDQAHRRTEIYDFTRALKKAGVTTMLTSEADADNQFASRYGIIEYLTDAVFVLRHVRPDNFRETRLAIEIQKIRDANHSRETKPYEITDTGISVYRQANIF